MLQRNDLLKIPRLAKLCRGVDKIIAQSLAQMLQNLRCVDKFRLPRHHNTSRRAEIGVEHAFCYWFVGEKFRDRESPGTETFCWAKDWCKKKMIQTKWKYN